MSSGYSVEMSSSLSNFGNPSSAAEKLAQQCQYPPTGRIYGFNSPVDRVQRPEHFFPGLNGQSVQAQAVSALVKT